MFKTLPNLFVRLSLATERDWNYTYDFRTASILGGELVTVGISMENTKIPYQKYSTFRNTGDYSNNKCIDRVNIARIFRVLRVRTGPPEDRHGNYHIQSNALIQDLRKVRLLIRVQPL